MSEEKKKFSYEFEGTKMTVKVDPNADGEALLEIKIDLAECADEVLSAIGKK